MTAEKEYGTLDSKIPFWMFTVSFFSAPIFSYLLSQSLNPAEVVGVLCLEMWIYGLVVQLLGLVSVFIIQLPNFTKSFSNADNIEPVSIVRPLCGDERGYLESNLESLINQQYKGEIETILCVGSENDSAYPIAHRFIQKHSDKNIKLIVWKTRLGLNAKVNSIYKGYEVSTKNWVFFVDSNVKAQPEYLARMMSYSQYGGVGAVSGVTTGTVPNNFWASMEFSLLNLYIAKGMSISLFVGVPLLCGKSMLVNRQRFDDIGGFDKFKDHLTEDVAISIALRQSGHKVEIAHVPTHQPLHSRSFWEVWNRFVRWGLYRKSASALDYNLAEVFVYNKWITGVLVSLGIYLLLNVNPLLFFMVHILFFFLVDVMNIFMLDKSDLGLLVLPTILFYDLFVLMLWMKVATTNEVEWCGKLYKISNDNKILHVTTTAQNS